MSAVQIFNYINKQINALNMACNEVMDLWKDYLAMAVKLNMDTNDAIIYRVRQITAETRRACKYAAAQGSSRACKRDNKVLSPFCPMYFHMLRLSTNMPGKHFPLLHRAVLRMCLQRQKSSPLRCRTGQIP